nr:hypothetical protein [Tanacetum cinerariifolium]
WRSRFLRYIDTRPNGDALRKCILSCPYKPTTVLVQVLAATNDSLAIPEHPTVKTPMNMSPANKAQFEAEKEAIHLILTGIGDEIYSIVDACQTAQEMWEAIERFYKLMNEMIRNNLTVATMQVNVQFLQQLQPEWSRFVTIVKQQHKLDEVSYHKKSYAPSSKPSIPTRIHTTTRYKGKEIAKLITTPSEIASEEDNNPKQAQRDKYMQKKLALIANYFKKIYKPTNNNLRTSSNSQKKSVDTTPRYKHDNQSRQFRNQRTELEAHYSYMAKIQEVPTADIGTDSQPLEQVQNDSGYNMFANDLQHSEQSESISNTCLVEMDDSNVFPDSLDMCDD